MAKNPVMVEKMAAGDYLLVLHRQSLLPGDSKDMHGILVGTGTYPLPNEATYPFSETFCVTIRDQTFTNNYTVMKASRGSSWQLQRAWRTDSLGNVIEEWPVK